MTALYAVIILSLLLKRSRPRILFGKFRDSYNPEQRVVKLVHYNSRFLETPEGRP